MLLCLPALFLTFGKVNPGPPQTDIFLGGDLLPPPPIIFVSAGPPQTDILLGGGGPPPHPPPFLSPPASPLRLTFFAKPHLAKKIRIWPICFRDRIWPNRIWPELVCQTNFGVLMFWPNFLCCCFLLLLLLLFLVVVACCCCCSWLLLVVPGCCLLVPVGACWCLLVVLVGGACWWCLFVCVVGGPPSAGSPCIGEVLRAV